MIFIKNENGGRGPGKRIHVKLFEKFIVLDGACFLERLVAGFIVESGF